MDFSEFREEDELEEQQRRPGCLSGLFRLALSLTVILFLIAALIPTLLSTDFGRNFVLSRVNAAVAPTQISLGHGSRFGWLSPLSLNMFRIVDANRGIDLTADQIAFDQGLLHLLPIGVLNMGQVTIQRPTLTLSPPLKTAQTEKREPQAPKKHIPFLPLSDGRITLTVRDGRVSASGFSPEPFEARQIAAVIALESYRKPITIQGHVQIGGGSVSLDGRLQSPSELVKESGKSPPEPITLKFIGIDLTALRPLIRQATGAPWVHSGMTEGAFTATVRNTRQFTIEGGLLINALSVAADGQPPSPKADLALMTHLSYDQGALSISKFEMNSPWLKAEAGGTLQAGSKPGILKGSIQAKAESDLAAVTRDFASLLHVSKGFKLQKGRLKTSVSVEGSESALRLDANAVTTDLALSMNGEPITLAPAPTLVLKASFPYGNWPEVETLQLKLPFAELQGSGRFDTAVVKGKLNLTLFSRDFKRILRDAPPMVGSAQLDLSTRREDTRIALNTVLNLSDVAAELHPGQRFIVPQGTLKAEAYLPLKESRPTGELHDAAFDLHVNDGRINGKLKRGSPARNGEPPVLRGLSVSADIGLETLRQLAGGVIPAATQQDLSAWSGRLIANATAETATGVTKAIVNAGVSNLEGQTAKGRWTLPAVRLKGAFTHTRKEGLRCETELTGSATLRRDGEIVYTEKNARATTDLTLAPDARRVRCDTLNVSSSLFELQAKADLSDLSSRCLINTKGQLTVDFDTLSRLLATKGADEFTLTGREAREFHLTTPLKGGPLNVLTEGEGAGSAFVGSVKGLGLTAGPADASLRLSKGHLNLTYAPSLNGGALLARAELVMGPSTLALRVPDKTRILDNVALTQKMADTLLSSLTPLFQGCTVLNGTVSLDMKQGAFTAGKTPKPGLAADMTARFKNLDLKVGPALQELLALVHVKNHTYRADQLAMHILVQDNRICVDPVTLEIDKQPITLSGWVAFDGTINYLIEVPVTEKWAGQTGGKLLKGVTVKIPVSGTVDKPRLDTRALKNTLGSLVEQAVGKEAAKKVGSFLEKLQQELKK